MQPVLISEVLKILFLNIWVEPSGKIFTLSIAYYLFSALVFSGYMSFFSGGYNSIPFGNFSLGDLLFFFPTMSVSIIASIFNNFWKTIWNFLYKTALPTFLGLLSGIKIHIYILNETHLLELHSMFLVLISFGVWFYSFLASIDNSHKYRKTFLITLQFFSSLLFILFAVGFTQDASSPPSPTTEQVTGYFGFLGDLIMTFFQIVLGILIPILIGKGIARNVIKNKLASSVVQLELQQKLNSLNKWLAIDSNAHSTVWNVLLKPKNNEPVNFTYILEDNLLLIASFKNTTAFYLTPNTESQRGSLQIISNDIIANIELKPKAITQKESDYLSK
ncbi:MAG: hypothetical protein HN390_16150 [Anaerolineae bacterium]|jgi:hypothetical protein|nr:hypothetical protein [Anaerolineae bacterium]MBT7191323.1 hypothetical protein [Anaerolineae bacterium]MBT7989044.1 hypothetical protein [Anaerolineae bacterium]